jgi:hypothetical protein
MTQLERISLAIIELARAISDLELWARKGAHHSHRLKDIAARGGRAKALIEGTTE